MSSGPPPVPGGRTPEEREAARREREARRAAREGRPLPQEPEPVTRATPPPPAPEPVVDAPPAVAEPVPAQDPAWVDGNHPADEVAWADADAPPADRPDWLADARRLTGRGDPDGTRADGGGGRRGRASPHPRGG